jgi:formylglycine-generating enzyme required for sulfatase activity
MTFYRWLPLLLLVPALTMADEDRNFKLTSENFKVGNVLERATNFAIVLDKSVAISQAPVFPLQANQLYLRHKASAKEYLWFCGDAKPEEYKNLHAFNLKENHLSAREVLGLRLYASRQYKAFQDEADIYFDAEYIYSPRVTKLLFMKNGKWQVLNESAHPGMVQINSDEKNLEIVSLNAKMKPGTRALYPVDSGTYVFSFNAPDQLPYADIGNLKAGEVLTFDVKFPAPDTSAAVSVDSNAVSSSSAASTDSAVASSSSVAVRDSNSVIAIPDFDAGVSSSSEAPAIVTESKTTSPAVPSVTIEQVQALKTLEETEALYDAFSADVDKNFKRVDTTEFSKFYPAIKPADSLGLVDSGKVYRGYVAHYSLKRTEAQNLWRQKKLGVVSNLYKAFHAKFDSLQALPLQINMMPVAIEKIMKAPDTTIVIDSSKSPADTIKKVVDSAKIDSLNLRFGADRERVDVAWKGVVDGYSMDTLVEKLAAGNSGLVTTLFLVNNKPVWVFKEGDLVGRYQYRYEKLGFRVGDSLYFGKGEFKLPKHILVEKEVEEWLKRGPESSSSVAPSSSSAAPDTVKAEPVFNVVEHATRGTVAIVDSGSFRYRGKVVSMSPFAIHTTEVTQEFFHKIMGLLDSTKRIPDKSAFKGANKPVQNITWENAQYACKVLGGDLPTEAQWEFAGRAGSNDGVLWTADDVMSVGKYAIFAENSFKRGKKDSAYGPHDVATKTPNAWGLYDMSGNVAEWTRDNYFAITFSIESSNPTGSFWGTGKVLKGGSWKDKEKKLNMTYRDDEDPRYWSDFIGFRCVFPLERIIQGKNNE